MFVLVLVGGQAAVGMRASRTASVTGDEPFYLLTTQSLLSDGDLDLRDEYRNREYRKFWDGTVDLWKQMEPAPDGRLLAPHEPGLSIAAVPAYAVAGLRGVQRFLVVLWALAMAASAVLARRWGAPAAAAGLAATVVGAGTPGVVYASQVYPEGPAALCVALALLGVTSRRSRPLVTSFALVMLLWLGVKYAPMAAAVGTAWLWRHRHQRRAVLTFVVVGILSAAHYCWWHLGTFGGLTPYGTNVVWAGEGTAAVLDSHLQVEGRLYRLYGLFLDARFGLFRWLPVAVLALWGVARRTALPTVLVVTAVATATFASITIMGWWFPGRLLVVALPAMVVLLAAGVSRLPRAALALSAWSVAIAAATVWSARTGGIRLAVDPFSLGAPLPPAVAFPDYRTFGARTIALSLLWATGLGLVGYATRRGRARSATPA